MSDKSQFDIEKGFISKILESGDIIAVKDKQIKPYFLTDMDYKKAYKYINDFYLKNGTVPTVRVFKKQFPDLELDTYRHPNTYEITTGTEEPLNYWCDEIRLKTKHNKLCEIVENMAESLNKLDTETAFSDLRKGLIYIENDIVETQAIDMTLDAEDRKTNYQKRKDNKGMIGIPTGIPKLDMILKGLQTKQLITMIAKTGVGKANPLSTPILTPTGFIPMRDVKVGTLVIGQDGRPYPVSSIHPQGVKDVYELTFSDGTTSRCCKEHLWKFKTTDDRVRNNDWRVDTLENIMKLPLKRGKSYNLVIPVNDPVEFEKQETKLPLDPYVLGVLLGDGGFTTDRISLTNPEKDIISECNSILSDWGYFRHHKGTYCQYEFKKNDNLNQNKLFRTIQQLGLQGKYSRTKFIPKQYLHSNIEERQRLLKGLFDTDGHVDAKGGYSISTFSEQLKEDIMYLCRSLGYRCLANKYSDEYKIVISTDDIIFSSNKHRERYMNRQVPKKKHDYKVLKIIDIKKVGEEECQCISVDSEDHTYLCDDFIVTHNTWFLVLIACYCLLNGYRILFLTTEMAEEQVEDRIEAMLVKMMLGVNFNYGRFKSGTLTKEEEEAYFELLDMKHTLEKLIIETATGVSNVSAKIDQYDPDLILIDGAYLMEDDRGAKDDWLRVAHITRDLKSLVKRKKKVMVINSQADSTTSKKTGPELDNIGFSKAIGQDSDVVLGLVRDEEMLEDREAKVKVLKQREGVLGSVMLNWDFTTMDFSQIYGEFSDEQSPQDESPDPSPQARGLVDIT